MLKKITQRILGINRLFLLTVVVPTLLSSLYFGLIASDIFISESRFLVRSPQKSSVYGLGSVLQATGLSRSQDDTYSVHDFILSRDALKELESELHVSKAFGDSRIDAASRFAGVDSDDSFEALHRYYLKRLNLNVDGVSAISVLRVSAFSAADAHRINEKLLALSERLVNQLNQRSQLDTVKFASAEVDSAAEKAKAATLAIAAFRTERSVFDPERQSSLQLQLVSKLQDEYISTKTQLAQIKALAKDNQQIPSLQKKLDVLKEEINSETTKVTGGQGSLSGKSAGYDRLVLDRAFAEKQFAGAMTALENARSEASRKQLYIDRIVQPSLPDAAVAPKRLRSVLATLVLGLIAWGILSLLLAGILEHRH